MSKHARFNWEDPFLLEQQLTEEERMIKDTAYAYCQDKLLPRVLEQFRHESTDVSIFREMGELGLLGPTIPEQYGGAGLNYVSYGLIAREVERVDSGYRSMASVQSSLVMVPINEFGTEEQKQRFLTDLCTGKKLAAFGLTEPNAGTDAAGQQTTAVLDGDEYVINGTKIFITNAGEADVYVIFAMTDKTKGTRGISAFILEKGTPGFTFGLHEKKLGIRGSATCELIFNNVRIPKENLLRKEGMGFKIAMQTLDGGRIGIAAQALGIAQGAIDEAVAYVKQRKQFGRPIAKFQNTQFQLADMQTKTDAARWLVYSAATAKQEGRPYTQLAAEAKLFAAETAMEVTTKAIQLFGGYGYTRDYPVERMMRDAKITEIYEGTSEVQRMVISGNLLK